MTEETLEKLKLPKAGFNFNTSYKEERLADERAFYRTNSTYQFVFAYNSHAVTTNLGESYGFSVRCIED